MPRNYWMVVQTPENFEISKDLGFKVHGMRSRQRRRAQRMAPDDRMLFYITGMRKWAAIATVTSKYFEDATPIWECSSRWETYPYRVNISPMIVMNEDDYIDALYLGPRLEYVKRWVPERWPLAFVDTLHLLPQRDFRLVEGEMRKIMSRGQKRHRRGRRGGGTGNRGLKLSAPQQVATPQSAAEGPTSGSG